MKLFPSLPQALNRLSTNVQLAKHSANLPDSVNEHPQDSKNIDENAEERHIVDVEHQTTAHCSEPVSKSSVYQGLGWLDRLLALWILLAIIIGVLLGNYVEGVGPALQRGKFAQVSVPIGISSFRVFMSKSDFVAAVGLLVMMYPILCKVKYETLHRVFAHRQIWVQIGFSVIMNWIVAPLLMASDSSCSC